MTIKNTWTLTADEAIVADWLKANLKRHHEIFIPLNSQLKDIDFVVFNLKNGKSKTVQVKGSRGYTDKHNDEYSWISVKDASIFKTTNKTDFFIFVWHVQSYQNNKRKIKQSYLVVPLSDLKKICKTKKVMRKNRTYHFYFWSDLKKYAADYPSEKNAKLKEIDFSKYLNNFKLLEK